MRLSESEIDRLIARAPVARLATVTPMGNPHIVPIVFAEVDGCIYSPIDGKPKRSAELARLRNATTHPEVSLLIDHYENDWRSLWWVRIDGLADVVTQGEIGLTAFQAATKALRRKYPQYDSTELFLGVPTLLRIRPQRRSAWSAVPNPIEL